MPDQSASLARQCPVKTMQTDLEIESTHYNWGIWRFGTHSLFLSLSLSLSHTHGENRKQEQSKKAVKENFSGAAGQPSKCSPGQWVQFTHTRILVHPLRGTIQGILEPSLLGSASAS